MSYDDVPDHDGRPRDAGDRFFGPPPPAAIGRLVTASTSLSRRAARVRWGTIAFTVVVCAMLGGMTAAVTAAAGAPHPILWAPLVVLAGAAIGFRVERPVRLCSYIGEDGAWLVAQSRLTGWTRTRLLRFADADQVELQVTRVANHHGIYQGTTVTATWRRAGRAVFTTTGGFLESAHANRDDEPLDRAAAFATTPARLAPVTLALVDAYDRWCARQVDDEAPLAPATLDRLVAHGAHVVAIAIARLADAGRWDDLDELAGTADAAGVPVPALHHAWALLELEDPETALAVSDHVVIRARAALARGAVDDADAALDELDRLDGAARRLALIVVADLLAATDQAGRARAALADAQRLGYPLATLAASAWPSAPLARALLGHDGPYR